MEFFVDKKKLTLKNFKLYQKEGKGISKNASDLPYSFKRFFSTYFTNFNKLVFVNIIMIFGNFPAFFLICNLAGYLKNEYYIPFFDVFQNIAGIFSAENTVTPYKMTIYALEGLQNQSLAPSTFTYVFYALGALILFTFGIVNAGTAYIVRNMVSGEPVFVFADFKYAVKRNYRQAIPFGIIDIAINAILIFNIYSLVTSTAKFFASMLFWSNVVLFILYFFVRYYIYVQMVTFKLSVFKIIKNSLIFALLGFKRNICAFIGIVLCIFIVILLFFGTGGLLVPFAVAAPLAILFSGFSFMKVYAAYPKIKQYMIDPYLEEHPEEKEKFDDDPIMKDDVTERERLEEIKKRNNIL